MPNKPAKAAAPEPDLPTPAEAAAAEAAGTEPEFITVPFRGANIQVQRATLAGTRWRLIVAAGDAVRMVTEAVPREQWPLFLSRVEDDADMTEVVGEFIAALSAAAGWGDPKEATSGSPATS